MREARWRSKGLPPTSGRCAAPARRGRDAHVGIAALKGVGLLGGSFNPAHRAHRRVSLDTIAALGLDEMWWLVSPGNPLKPVEGMAPLSARLMSARAMARRSPIRATAIEQRLGTRYTVDTLARLVRRYPHQRFIWIMGTDNLVQFSRWKGWRRIARTVPIAVVARPGYDGSIRAVRAMGWLSRFIRPRGRSRDWMNWRPPALVLLRFRPDPMSATGLRARDPDWHLSYRDRHPCDPVTRRTIL